MIHSRPGLVPRVIKIIGHGGCPCVEFPIEYLSIASARNRMGKKSNGQGLELGTLWWISFRRVFMSTNHFGLVVPIIAKCHEPHRNSAGKREAESSQSSYMNLSFFGRHTKMVVFLLVPLKPTKHRVSKKDRPICDRTVYFVQLHEGCSTSCSALSALFSSTLQVEDQNELGSKFKNATFMEFPCCTMIISVARKDPSASQSAASPSGRVPGLARFFVA